MAAIGSDRVGSVYTEDYSTTEPETECDKFSDDEYENASQSLDTEKKSSPPPDPIDTSDYKDVEIDDDPESPRKLIVAWECDVEPNSTHENTSSSISLDPSLQPLHVKALSAIRVIKQEIVPDWKTNDKKPASQTESHQCSRKNRSPEKQRQYNCDLSPDSTANVFLRFGSRDSF